jgi:hypothetical protein
MHLALLSLAARSLLKGFDVLHSSLFDSILTLGEMVNDSYQDCG